MIGGYNDKNANKFKNNYNNCNFANPKSNKCLTNKVNQQRKGNKTNPNKIHGDLCNLKYL